MTLQRLTLLIFSTTFISACSPPQESALRDYLNAKNTEDRYNRICQSEQIQQEDLEKAYKGVKLGDTRKITIDQKKSKKVNDLYYILEAKTEYDDGSSDTDRYHVQNIDKQWCVDWISFSRNIGPSFNEMFVNGTKGGRGFFRVQISDYYNYELRNAQNSHYSLYDLDLGKHYYLRKSTDNAKSIFDCVNGDGYCIISADVSYPPTRQDADILLLQNAKLVRY